MVTKPDFPAIKRKLAQHKEYFLHDVKDFLLFVVTAILGTLIFYRQTGDELTATLILSLLWYFFWRESDLQGKVFLVAASVVGYIHELIGVKAGFFTYYGGFFGGVPLWVLPGYGAIFWAAYNFWKIFEETYKDRKWFSKIPAAAIGITIALAIVDAAFFDLPKDPIFITLGLALSLLLFKNLAEVRMAYFVATFTVFDEIAGEFIGTWHHPIFSIFSLMSGYVFFLWIALSIKEILQGTKKWRAIEIIGAILFLAIFAKDVLKGLSG